MAPRHVVRSAERHEIGDVLEFWRDTRGSAGTTDDREVLVHLLSSTNSDLLVVEDAGRIVGSIIAAWDGWRGNMYRLLVHPDFRQLGLARQLIEAAEDHLRRAGARRISILVWLDNERAMKVWQAAGYEHEPKTARLVRNIGRGPDSA
jgi:ribosomal protein S18 acetylase RimI-like enzyme